MLAERRVAIVLDDAARANQILPLVPESASSLIIITSRRHLTGVPHARTISLDVLPTPDAIALFRRFAGEDRTVDLRLLRRIIQLCGHLPLAIELVATRFKARTAPTLSALADRLSQQPGRLSGLRAEDKSVSRAFDRSYQSLNREQHLRNCSPAICSPSPWQTGSATTTCCVNTPAPWRLGTKKGQDLAVRLGYSLAGYLGADCDWQEAESVLHRAATASRRFWSERPSTDSPQQATNCYPRASSTILATCT